jgi:hypothetical protein
MAVVLGVRSAGATSVKSLRPQVFAAFMNALSMLWQHNIGLLPLAWSIAKYGHTDVSKQTVGCSWPLESAIDGQNVVLTALPPCQLGYTV